MCVTIEASVDGDFVNRPFATHTNVIQARSPHDHAVSACVYLSVKRAEGPRTSDKNEEGA